MKNPKLLFKITDPRNQKADLRKKVKVRKVEKRVTIFNRNLLLNLMMKVLITNPYKFRHIKLITNYVYV